MSPNKLVHIGHEHPLILINDFVISTRTRLLCYVCQTSIFGLSPAYTCSLEHTPCKIFMHKKCAESPDYITHLMHPQHQLSLKTTADKVHISCAACAREINDYKLAYLCSLCKINTKCDSFALCARCAIMEPVLEHEGHEQHPLTLLCRRACFSCDACGTKAEEYGSYSCHICQYWIHSSCAASPRTIKLQIHEDDTLQLVYSVPDMYRTYTRHCQVCRREVKQNHWAYFCEESGYFVHIKCANDSYEYGQYLYFKNRDDDRKSFPYLMQFPRPHIDSLVSELIAELQSGWPTDTNTKIEAADNEKEGNVINHWSHPKHPLILLKELPNDDDDDDDYDDYGANNHIDKMLVCNGCVQPISTASNQYYYGCILCSFFLHTTCANHSTLKFPPGRHSLYYEHKLKLNQHTLLLESDICKVCHTRTNGFTYKCQTCCGHICICCYLAPQKLKHEYHKHPLVHGYAAFKTTCNACLQIIPQGFHYKCETCPNINIHLNCALTFPKTILHSWDSHSISLTYPPIYYKGLKYCETCELEVNPEAWLYRCSKCDQCFHPLCIQQPHHLKLGNIVDPSAQTLHEHNLTIKLVDKDRYPERLHKSLSCREKICKGSDSSEPQQLHLECAGCNYLICLICSGLDMRARVNTRSFCGELMRLACVMPHF